MLIRLGFHDGDKNSWGVCPASNQQNCPRPPAPPLSYALTSQALRALFCMRQQQRWLSFSRSEGDGRSLICRVSGCHMRVQHWLSPQELTCVWTAAPTSVPDVVAPAGGSWTTKTPPPPASLCAAANRTKPRAVPLPNWGAVIKLAVRFRSLTASPKRSIWTCLFTDRAEPVLSLSFNIYLLVLLGI